MGLTHLDHLLLPRDTALSLGRQSPAISDGGPSCVSPRTRSSTEAPPTTRHWRRPAFLHGTEMKIFLELVRVGDSVSPLS